MAQWQHPFLGKRKKQEDLKENISFEVQHEFCSEQSSGADKSGRGQTGFGGVTDEFLLQAGTTYELLGMDFTPDSQHLIIFLPI